MAITGRPPLANGYEFLINQEIEQFLKWHNGLSVTPPLALQEKGQAIRDIQLDRAFECLGDLSNKQEKVIRAMANSIVNQILHTPIVNLKDMATTQQGHLYAEILQNLFDVEIKTEKSAVFTVRFEPIDDQTLEHI